MSDGFERDLTDPNLALLNDQFRELLRRCALIQRGQDPGELAQLDDLAELREFMSAWSAQGFAWLDGQ